MSRCSICDATHDGQLSERPFKRSRTFSEDPHKPWLLVCSDCSVFGRNGAESVDYELLEGEIPNVEQGWDNE